MTYRDPRVTCEPWVTENDLCCAGAQTTADCDGDVTLLTYKWSDEELIKAASDLLYARTCYKYPGQCIQTVWPCLGCNSCGSHPCGCGSYFAIWLTSDFPILEILEITIDGVVVDPATYRLEENERVVKTDGIDWPRCNNLGLTAGPHAPAGSELLVTYSAGRMPPPALKMAAAELVCELKKACQGDASCKLPDHVRSITRRGVEMEIDSVFSLLDSGLTGNAIIDHALSVYGKCSNSNVFDPLARARCGKQVVKDTVAPPDPSDDDLIEITFIDYTDSPYHVTDADELILVDCCDGDVEIVLPANHPSGKRYEFKDWNCCAGMAFNIFIYSEDGDSIDEQSGYTIATGCQSIMVESDSQDWWIV